MNYMLTIAKEGGITRAANKLFITQSALDQQLLKLEKELGVQLFNRSRKSCTPTQAGDIYLAYAEQIVALKHEAYQKIHDIALQKKGTLSVAFAPERGMEMFMAVYPTFYETYSKVTVIPREIKVKQQIEMLQKGELDIGFVSTAQLQMPNIISQTLMTEEFLLVTPLTHPLAKQAAPNGQPLTVLEDAALADLVYCLMYKESTQRPIIDAVFKNAAITPDVFLETASNRANLSMVEKGLACSIVPSFYVRGNENICKFRIKSAPSWSVSACYRQGGYLSRAARHFIAQAKDYLQQEG